ncbi:MAG: RNA methyltransferase substrate-binding domain-containing protein, partial [Bacillota bacterium]
MAQIEGRNPVIAALKAGRLEEILILETAQGQVVDTIYDLAAEQGVKINQVTKDKLDHRAKSHAHQGVIAYGQALDYWDLDELVQYAKEEAATSEDKEAPLLVL